MEKNNVLVHNLCKSFGDFSLKDVSFQVPKGRIVGFIGENGAGKSTTINLILNELEKDDGKIEIFGVEHTIYSIKNDIGVVFDECNFHDIFTAKHIAKILSGVYTSWDDELYKYYLEKFNLPLEKTIGSFSKGMKMKLSIKNKSYKQLYISYCTSLNMFFHYKIKNIDYPFHIKNPRFHTEIKTGILITRNFLKHLNFVVTAEDDTKLHYFL
ncbi:ATP-binding cassette domain-containing protein [Clostridioides sp. ZZV15-6383]|uniref:ATP-binding cassette domain-containing protein n=1 Tax=Clostridioides sp. ZZV15-6383 TaxID=2811498 RepID=UPI001D59C0AF|nr:ATP-binding cassette domain-containing protein [Clostridioides sp. ZZV15-6383]